MDPALSTEAEAVTAPRESTLVVLVHDLGGSWVGRMAELAHLAGCRVGLVTAAGPEQRAEFTGLVDAVAVVADPTDIDAVVNAAARMGEGRTPGAVLSMSDGCVPVAAQVADRLGLRRTPAAPIVLARNKHRARRVMHAAGVPQPGFGLLAGPDAAPAVAHAVGLPAVVKPVNGTGSHLVRTVDSPTGLAAAYRELVDRMPAGSLGHLYHRPLDEGGDAPVDPARTVLVERALQGREFCVDLIVRDGEAELLALVDKFLIDERFFELGFVCPPFELPADRARQIRTAVQQAVRALGLDNTLAHVEIIDDRRIGPAVVEVNAGRPGGHASTILNTLTNGVDTAAELVAVHRGAPSPRTAPKLPVPLASLKLYPPGAGRVRAVHGLAEVADHPDVVTVFPAVEPGEIVTEDHETHAATAVVAGFLDRDDLVATYRELAAAVRLEFDPQ